MKGQKIREYLWMRKKNMPFFAYVSLPSSPHIFQTLALCSGVGIGWLHYFSGYWLVIFNWILDLCYGLENTLEMITGGFIFPDVI